MKAIRWFREIMWVYVISVAFKDEIDAVKNGEMEYNPRVSSTMKVRKNYNVWKELNKKLGIR